MIKWLNVASRGVAVAHLVPHVPQQERRTPDGGWKEVAQNGTPRTALQGSRKSDFEKDADGELTHKGAEQYAEAMKKYKSECVKIAAELTCFALTGSVAASGTGSAPASASASATGSAPGSASAGVEVSRPVLNGYYAVTFCPVWRGWGKETNAAGAVTRATDNGKFHGQGKLTGPDGTVVLEGTWKDGYHEVEYAEAIDALTAEVGSRRGAEALRAALCVDEEAQEFAFAAPRLRHAARRPAEHTASSSCAPGEFTARRLHETVQRRAGDGLHRGRRLRLTPPEDVAPRAAARNRYGGT